MTESPEPSEPIWPSAWAAWDAMPDGVLTIGADWTLHSVNEAAARLIDRDPGRLVGQSVWEAFPAMRGGATESHLRKALLGQGQVVSWQSAYDDATGTYETRAFRVADRLVVIFRNVDDRREVEAQREALLARTRLLLLLSEALADTSTVDGIAVTIVSAATTHLGAAYAGLSLVDEATATVRTLATGQLDGDIEQRWEVLALTHPGPVPQVARRGVAIFHESFDSIRTTFPEAAPSYVAAGLRSGAVVPLVIGGSIIGALSIAWRDDHTMDTDARSTILALGGYTAQAVQRALAQQQHASAAEILQRAMLTQLPAPDHLEITARYLPARQGAQVGGDWYDALVLPDGATCLVIGDVSGHDMSAAATMGQLRNVTRAFTYAFEDPPSLILQRVDGAIAGLRINSVATAVLGRIEQDDDLERRNLRQLRWSNAGHPPPLLLSVDGTVELLETEPELVLGIEASTPRSDHVVDLPPGCTLLLFTDGLIEHRGSDITAGLAQLVDVVRSGAHLPLTALLDHVATSLGADSEDDIAILGVRLHSELEPRPVAAGPAHL